MTGKTERAPAPGETLRDAYRDAVARRDVEEIERLDAIPRGAEDRPAKRD